MRTTIRLDDQLLADAKRAATESGRSLTAFVEDALRETLARRRAVSTRKRVELRTFKGGALLPGVDLDDSASLLDLMERPDAAP
jgi:hypothetical protein